MIFLGEQAQNVLWPFLKNDVEAYLFSPSEVRKAFDEKRKRERKSPMTPSQRRRTPKATPKRQPGERYTTASYGSAVRRACKVAGIPLWSPNRLRHNAATNIRREFGIEKVRTVLGHSSAVTSEIYAEMDFDSAREIMGKIG